MPTQPNKCHSIRRTGLLLHLAGRAAAAYFLAITLNACGGGGSSVSDLVPVPTLPAAGLNVSRPGTDLIYDAVRDRIYASVLNVAGYELVSINPLNGTQTVLIEAGPDVPHDFGPGTPSRIALSSSGRYLFIATETGQLIRYHFATQRVDVRMDPPAAVAQAYQVARVVASPLDDERAFVLLEPGNRYSSSHTAAMATLVGEDWAPGILDLGARLRPPSAGVLDETGYGIWINPAGTEILHGPGEASKRILVEAGLPASYTSVNVPVVDDSFTPPQFTARGLLWNAQLFDAATFAPLFVIPGATDCVALKSDARVACSGPNGPDGHRLFVYDLQQRAEISGWMVGTPLDPQSFVNPLSTGRMLYAGPGRVAVQYSTVFKAIFSWGYTVYFHPSLN